MNAGPDTALRSVTLGKIHANAVTCQDAIDAIVAACAARRGGFVVTPNIDHIVLAEESAEFEDAYRKAFLSLPDGAPLPWIARLLGSVLPEKVSGSDLTLPLVRAAAAAGVEVFLLGATPETCDSAAAALRRDAPGARIVGQSSPAFALDGDPSEAIAACASAGASGAGLVLVAMGAPKQEVLMARYSGLMNGAVAIGIGGTLRFLAGEIDRCPAWISRMGFEWLHRLVKEPRRLAHRYLVRDRAIVGIIWRQWRVGRGPAAGSGRVGL